MPITIKTANMKYKNSEGEYVGVNAISDNTTAEQLARIEDKGDEVIASIPSDYTALETQVNNIEGMIASEFSTSTAYAIGDLVIYNDHYYRFKTAHPAGAWNASHVDQTTVSGEIISNVTDLKNSITAIEPYINPEYTSFFDCVNLINGWNNKFYPYIINSSNVVVTATGANSIIVKVKPSTTYYFYAPNMNRNGYYAFTNDTVNLGDSCTTLMSDVPFTYNGGNVRRFTTASDTKAVMIFFYYGEYSESDIKNIRLVEVWYDTLSPKIKNALLPDKSIREIEPKYTNFFNDVNYFDASKAIYYDNMYANAQGLIMTASNVHSLCVEVTPNTTYYFHAGYMNRNIVVGNENNSFTKNLSCELLTTSYTTDYISFTTSSMTKYVFIYFYSGTYDYTTDKANITLNAERYANGNAPKIKDTYIPELDSVKSLKDGFTRIDHPCDNIVTELIYNQDGRYNTDNTYTSNADSWTKWGYTDLIPCEEGRTYYINLNNVGLYLNFYNENKEFISGYNAKWKEAPVGAKYIRISCPQNYQPETRLTVDTFYRNYLDYKVDIDGKTEKGKEDIVITEFSHPTYTPITYNPQTAIKLKVGTYNIGHFNYGSSDYFGIRTDEYDVKLHNWREFFCKMQFDIFNINEYVPYIDYLARADALTGTKKTTSYVLKPQFMYFDSTMDTNRKDAVVVSKYPLSNAAEYVLNGLSGKTTGYCKYHTVTIDASHVIGVYGIQMPYQSAFDQAEDSEESVANREAILDSLSTVIANHNDSYKIIMGDVNTASDDDFPNVLSFCSDNNLVPCNGGFLDWMRTYNNHNVCLDNILVSNNIHICDFNSHIEWYYGLSSDHLAVSAEIILP